MPKAVNAGSQIRRSSRLEKRKDGQGTDLSSAEQSRQTKRRKVLKDDDIHSTSSPCAAESSSRNKVLGSLPVNRRHSKRVTASELGKRESILLKKEEECDRRAEELDERCRSVKKLEAETSLRVLHAHRRETRGVLSQLEDHYTCALCYEVLAFPYSLNPAQCGHTFCAICILKWFFSRLHKACGSWHESVDCPICRSLLVLTPERTPRHESTFPFVPNRIVQASCESLLEKLRTFWPSDLVKRESSVGALPAWDMDCKSHEEDDEDTESSLKGWNEGGHLRTEWLRKDKEGRKEMAHLIKCWPSMKSQDFIMMKTRLGV